MSKTDENLINNQGPDASDLDSINKEEIKTIEEEIIEDVAKQDYDDDKESGLFRNCISFNYESKNVTLSVSKEKKDGYRRFYYKKLPKSIHKIYKDIDDKNKFVWLKPKVEEGADVIDVELKKHAGIASYWYSWQIYNYLKEKFRIVRWDFVNDMQYWDEVKDNKQKYYIIFKKYTLKVICEYDSDTAKLEISYNGISKVLPVNLDKLLKKEGIKTGDIKKVVYNKRIELYNNLSDEAKYNNEKVYPLLNHDLIKKLKFKFNSNKPKYKLTNEFNNILDFFNKYINNDDFKKIIPHQGKWDNIKNSQIHIIKKRSKELVFGNNNISNNIQEGIKNYGPAKLVEANNVKIFYIYNKSDAKKKDIINEYLIGETNFINLNKFTRINLFYDKSKDIEFENNDKIVEFVKGKIETMEKGANDVYFAFYLSPIQKTCEYANDYSVYHRVKEILLKKNIMSQVIDGVNFKESNFKFSVENIGIAMIAKLGGIPWKINNDESKDLLVGFGAISSGKYDRKYVSSAFCFDNNGMFEEFDYWPALEDWAIYGTLAKAIKKYKEKNNKIKRVIIHYYKPFRKKDFKRIDAMIDDIATNIPVIVVKINSSFEHSELVLNSSNNRYLPVNGCYVKLKYNDYLLHINCNDGKSYIKNAPMPLKLTLQANRVGILNDDLIEDIMQQLYDFSMLHWRSVTQPRLPVTIAYPQLVARIAPWFCGDTIPVGVGDRLWFL